MLKKKLTKLVGIKKELFDTFIETSQIKAQPAFLIPTLKTGDEMALTSIFLSSIRLIDEFREGIFKDIKLSRSGKLYYFTEVTFPEISSNRIDGMIINVTSGKIKEAAFFEMKSKNNGIDKNQVETYISVAKKLGVQTMVTVSNEFVSDPSHSPVQLRIPKSISLYHLSWTYLLTRGQLLLFKNDFNIKDEDQIEIMREVLCYLESPLSGVLGFMQMKPGWKEVCEYVKAGKKLRISDTNVEEAVLSWHEEEKDVALLLSRKLGVLVKSSSKNPNSLKADIKRLVGSYTLLGSLSVKNSVSDIKVRLDFEKRTVSMSVKIIPPLNKGTVARNSWIGKQLENCSKKSELAFNRISKNVWLEGDIKFARDNIKIKLTELDQLNELTKGKEVQAYHVTYLCDLGVSFASVKKFITLMDKMALDFYEGIVQNMTNWNKPAPKLERS
ncbi:hypothetical protein MTsPCn9_31450 [Croceitalea sp. MTPC9]|uniref:hypothetical protein n=1 Tax=unclassified Croceitalea TaxID=2632280 RepID=UPI002B3BF3BD|nr:hypothetical protein MTsPCn6_17170 [Croceitalea sp. MTPC6]GMN18205.1 hypothetical protein MTsPCn9_31450 [Croceitalea sp. MTPC9]